LGGTIIILLWGIISALEFIEYVPFIKEIESNNDKFIVLLIFLISGPFFAITNIFNYILDILMPEGWNDEDDSDKFDK
jgi:hypothetical protein